MSLVIAIKDRNRIVLGADKQVSTGVNKSHTSTKIWEVHDCNGAIMGSVGIARATQIIQYSDVVDKNFIKNTIDTEFIVRSLAPTLVATLRANGINCGNEEDACVSMPNAFLFAYQDKAWMIWNDLSVAEIDEYLAIGSGSDVAQGALFATAGMNPFDRIVMSIRAAAETTLYVDSGLDILTTYDLKDDAKHIAKAVGLDISKMTKEELDSIGIESESEEPPKPAKKKLSKSKAKKTAKVDK